MIWSRAAATRLELVIHRGVTLKLLFSSALCSLELHLKFSQGDLRPAFIAGLSFSLDDPVGKAWLEITSRLRSGRREAVTR
jgi:hypothetical protein